MATHLLEFPCRGTVTQIFGVNREAYERFGLPGHNGVDFAFDTGTPIYLRIAGLADGGRASDSLAICCKARDGENLGRFVVLHVRDTRVWEHGYFLLYAHLDEDVVTEGIGVANGWLIGRMGSTGNSTGPHLHFALYPATKPYPHGREWPGTDGPGWLAYIDRNASDGYMGAVDPLPYMRSGKQLPAAHKTQTYGPPIGAKTTNMQALETDKTRTPWWNGLLEPRPGAPWVANLARGILARVWKSLLVPMLLLSPWVANDVSQALICPLSDRVALLQDLCQTSAIPSTEAVPAHHDQVTRLPGQTGIVDGPLNVRSGPDISHSWVQTLQDGTIVTVHESIGSWHRIGPARWVHSGYVELQPRG